LFIGIALGCSAAALAQAAPASSSSTDMNSRAADWPAYNRTLSGDRFSPLTSIRPSNVARLRQVCSYALPEVTSFQTGPLVIDGTMYFTTDQNSYAIDAANCALKWMHHRASTRPSALGVNRGFAYLNGVLYRGTSDAHVLALAASDGHPLWDQHVDADAPGVSIPMAPIAADGRVYVGTAGGDNVGVTGHVYALDARDGHLLWRFDTVPPAARASWTNPKLPISGGAFWTSFSLDRSKGILYVPAGNPAPDFDTLDRTGDDLYANSIIAIDAATGRMLGYNQLVKRDTHDWDVDSAPTLVTTRAGREIIASANKDGLLSILDRSGISTAPPSSDSYAAPPIIPLRAQTPTTTRSNVTVPLSADRTVHFCPGYNGGTEWNGAAYSPMTNALFVAAVDRCANVRLQRPLTIPPAGQLWFGSITAQRAFDPISEARGWVTAFNAETGAVRWKFKGPHPMLAGVTPTAGGLVFAADLQGTVYALDQRDGHMLWHTDTGQSIGGGLVSYEAGGRQLIGVAVGMRSPVWPGGAQMSRVVIYGLPSE
jgi:alcohol dehydrogenase (cytochrome c)